MSDLVAFLRARIDEDERLARVEIERRAAWRRDLDKMHRTGDVPGIGFLDYDASGAPGDPARVLAEVEAKRRILEIHEPYVSEAHGGHACWICNPGVPFPCDTLRVVAQLYADHPDFDPVWAPGPEIASGD